MVSEGVLYYTDDKWANYLAAGVAAVMLPASGFLNAAVYGRVIDRLCCCRRSKVQPKRPVFAKVREVMRDEG